MAAHSLLGFLPLSLSVIAALLHSLPSTYVRFSQLQINHRHCMLPSPHGSFKNCYDNKCWCTENIANCSHNYGSLLFVPKLLPSIQVLDLSYNNLTTIPDDFFANVTNITHLVLSNNALVNISYGAFGALKRLETLTMERGGDFKEASMIRPVFEGHTLKCVDLIQTYVEALPDNVYNTSILEELFLYFNRLGNLNLSMFETVPNLRLLDLSSNNLQILVQGYLRNLAELFLSMNRLRDFPDMCSTAGRSLLPRLSTLDLKGNLIQFIPSRVCLPNLDLLLLDRNRIKTVESNMFEVTRFPKLRFLHLQQEIPGHMRSIQHYAFNNSRLKVLSLHNNQIDFSQEDIVESDSFAGCSSLSALNIGGNTLSQLTDERFHRLFGNLTDLKFISLSGTSLRVITVRTFAPFPHLQTLILHVNRLAEIPDGAFANNPRLANLELNDNQIATVRPTTFTERNQETLNRLDLSENPFVCDCELRWFSEWLVKNKTIFNFSYSNYTCSNLPVKVESFTIPDQACMLSRGQSKLILGSVTVVLLAAILFSSVFRFRWHIRLLLYEAFRGNEEARRRRLEAGRFDYDVFVSYAAEDCQWVLNHLMPELEECLGLRLCVHERDFIPGKNIVDNIADCVEQSKKILMVFSRDFVRSQWCQFELSYCLRHVLDNDDALIIVCLDDVASRDPTSAMMAVMKTTVYIQWRDDDADALASFWGRLGIALREVAPFDQH